MSVTHRFKLYIRQLQNGNKAPSVRQHIKPIVPTRSQCFSVASRFYGFTKGHHVASYNDKVRRPYMSISEVDIQPNCYNLKFVGPRQIRRSNRVVQHSCNKWCPSFTKALGIKHYILCMKYMNCIAKL